MQLRKTRKPRTTLIRELNRRLTKVLDGDEVSEHSVIRHQLIDIVDAWTDQKALRVLGHWAHRWFRRRADSSSLGKKRKKIIDVPIVLLAMVCVSATVVAVAGAFQGWLPWWASLVLGLAGGFAGFTPVHEAVHGNISRWKTLNALVGHACSLLLTGAFRPYCFLHREHHLHTNLSTQDPDYWCGQGPTWSLPLRWLTQDIGYLKYYCSKWSTRPTLERADLLLCSIIYIGLAIGSPLINPSLCYALFVGWFVPARLALFALAATFSWLPHQPHMATDPYHATNVHSSQWLTWILLGQNYHLVHHLDPSVPFYKLEQIWRKNQVEYLSRGAVDRNATK